MGISLPLACDNRRMKNQSQGTFKVKGLVTSDQSVAGVLYDSPVEAAWHMEGMAETVTRWVSDDLTGALEAIRRESPDQVVDESYVLGVGTYYASKFRAAIQAKQLAASIYSPLYVNPESPLFGSRPMTGDGIAKAQRDIQRTMIPPLLDRLEQEGFRIAPPSENDVDAWILPPADSF